MGMFGIFKIRKPRQFNPKFRYYDEHKERLKESEERVRQALGEEPAEPSENIKKQHSVERIHTAFRESLENSRIEKKEKTRMGLLIGLVLIVLFLLIHYAF